MDEKPNPRVKPKAERCRLNAKYKRGKGVNIVSMGAYSE